MFSYIRLHIYIYIYSLFLRCHKARKDGQASWAAQPIYLSPRMGLPRRHGPSIRYNRLVFRISRDDYTPRKTFNAFTLPPLPFDPSIQLPTNHPPINALYILARMLHSFTIPPFRLPRVEHPPPVTIHRPAPG
jgi:hypothetical protein